MKKIQEHLLREAAAGDRVGLYFTGAAFPAVTLTAVEDGFIRAVTEDGAALMFDGEALIGYALNAGHSAPVVPAPQKPDFAALLSAVDTAVLPDWTSPACFGEQLRAYLENFPAVAAVGAEAIEVLSRSDPGAAELAKLSATLRTAAGIQPECRDIFEGQLCALVLLAQGEGRRALALLLEKRYYWPAAALACRLLGRQEAFDLMLPAIRESITGGPLSDAQWQSVQYYARVCIEQGDVSGLRGIPAALDSEEIDLRFALVLLRLIREKDADFALDEADKALLTRCVAGETLEDESVGTLLDLCDGLYRQMMTLWPAPAPCTADRWKDVVAAQTPPDTQENSKTATDAETSEAPDVVREQYSVGWVDWVSGSQCGLRVETEDGRERSDTLYLNFHQIVDPLLVRRLNKAEPEGTQVVFRLGDNKKGVCAADAVLTEKECRETLKMIAKAPDKDVSLPSYMWMPLSVDRKVKERFGGKGLMPATDSAVARLQNVRSLRETMLGNPNTEAVFASDEECWNAALDLADIPSAWGVDRFQNLLEQKGFKTVADTLRAMRAGMPTTDQRTLAATDVLEVLPALTTQEQGKQLRPERPAAPAGPEDMSPEELWNKCIVLAANEGRNEDGAQFCRLALDKLPNRTAKLARRVEGMKALLDSANTDVHTLTEQKAAFRKQLTMTQQNTLHPFFTEQEPVLTEF